MTIKAIYIRRRLILCHHIYKELLQVPMKSGTEVCVKKKLSKGTSMEDVPLLNREILTSIDIETKKSSVLSTVLAPATIYICTNVCVRQVPFDKQSVRQPDQLPMQWVDNLQ